MKKILYEKDEVTTGDNEGLKKKRGDEALMQKSGPRSGKLPLEKTQPFNHDGERTPTP